MEEGVLVSWQVKVGDSVKPGDVLAEVETDKATMDLENYEKGEILHLHVKEGATVPIDSIIAVIGKKGESFEDLLSAAPEPAKESNSEVKSTPAEPVPQEKTAPTQASAVSVPVSDGSRVKASPLARKLASDKGLNIATITGSGEGGRIVKRDVENFTPASTPVAAVSGRESYTDIPVSQMRKTIARRLGESKFTAPHFYLTMEIRMDEAVRARTQMNEYSDVKISMNDLIVKACAIALRKHPMVNASWLGDVIRQNHHVHVGVAMAVDEGLLVPVVKFADNKSLSAISEEVKAYSVRAREKKLQPADWEGNTFTVSNLGMFGIEEFTAIINPPDSCILAVGGVKETVIVQGGEMKPAQIMKVTLSCDHRVVDGVTGAKFLQTLKELLEQPVKLLV